LIKGVNVEQWEKRALESAWIQPTPRGLGPRFRASLRRTTSPRLKATRRAAGAC